MQWLIDLIPRIPTFSAEHLVAIIALAAMGLCGFALFIVLQVVT